jgi:hypothetical protein
MDKIEEGIQQFLEVMLDLTVRLVVLNDVGKLVGWASGFMYQPDKTCWPIVITAGHQLPPKGVYIETRQVDNGQLLCLEASEFEIFHTAGKIDYAFSHLVAAHELPAAATNAQLIFTTYEHQFVKAQTNEAYGFAVYSIQDLVRTGHGFEMHRDACFELGMELVEEGEYISLFKTAGTIQSHAHYKGASGSPVADPEGAITGILVGGTDPEQYLRIARLDNIILPSNKKN